MISLKDLYSNIIKSKRAVFVLFFIVNLPVLVITFHTGNFSDDYQYTNLFAVKAKFSPLVPLLLEPTGGNEQGGHFAPAYSLINYLGTLFTPDPRFFHCLIVIIFLLTGFLLSLFVEEYLGDRSAGILAAVFFLTNYYCAFKSLSWNCFHSHLVNTCTGLLSIYFLLRFLKAKNSRYFLISAVALITTVLNLESGFVFIPLLFIITFFFFIKKKASMKKTLVIFLIFSLIAGLYPLGSYFQTGKPIPLSYRFQQKRSIQGYIFNASELAIKSTGLAFLYYKYLFNKLKENPQLKRTITQLIRENKRQAIHDLAGKWKVFLVVFLLLFLLIYFAMVFFIIPRLSQLTRVLVLLYAVVFFIFVAIFYRTDIANATALFSSILIAKMILSLLRSKRGVYRRWGYAAIGLYSLVTILTIFDKFDDCYRKSFFGLSRIALHGPDKVYKDINKVIGGFAQNGIILFTHDYSSYHSSGGVKRIGDILGVGDFACYNATVYADELLETAIPAQYRNRTFYDFYSQQFLMNPSNQKVTVVSKEQALAYLREHAIDTAAVAAVYVSEDYQVSRLE